MSQPETPSPELRESLQVSSLTLLVLVLLPCVVVLLLLNCLLLGYKLLLFARRRRRARYGSESVLLNSLSSLSTRQRIARFNPRPIVRPCTETEIRVRVRGDVGAARHLVPHLLCRAGGCVRPAPQGGGSGATGPGHLCGLGVAPTGRQRVARLATDCSGDCTVQRLGNGARECRTTEFSRTAGDAEQALPHKCWLLTVESQQVIEHGSSPLIIRRSSTVELELISLDKVHLEGELVSSIPQETSCFLASTSTSAAGPGLDSDFGASAGVSLRILSADSDGFPGATWASGLEWDYYDPSYVTQNHVPKHRHHAPPITAKQYWV
ncbi:hypothetical protein QTP86_029752 [Hemibagrus guttatus]|nr:hypothetical protein QTP86_029752 [Hemibagrus guttatus]